MHIQLSSKKEVVIPFFTEAAKMIQVSDFSCLDFSRATKNPKLPCDSRRAAASSPRLTAACRAVAPSMPQLASALVPAARSAFTASRRPASAATRRGVLPSLHTASIDVNEQEKDADEDEAEEA